MEIVPIPADSYTLGFIGAGKMAESIAKGAVRSGVLPPSRIRTAHSNPARRAAFEAIGVTVLASNDDVVRESNVVIFSVKPQVGIATRSQCRFRLALDSFFIEEFVFVAVKDAVLKLKPLLTKNKLLVSVAAGVKLKDLQVLGAASMVTQTGKHPGQLKDDVTSPGGTTIAGVHELEKGGFRGTLMNAVVAAAKRSRELS